MIRVTEINRTGLIMGNKLSALQFDIPNENNKCKSQSSLSNPTTLSFIFFYIRAEGGSGCQ